VELDHSQPMLSNSDYLLACQIDFKEWARRHDDIGMTARVDIVPSFLQPLSGMF